MRLKTTIRNRYVLFGDLALIILGVIGSYALRLELASNFFIYLPSMYWMIGVALVIKPITFYLFGLYKRIWIYASIQELKIILAAVTTASVFVSGLMIILFTTGAFYAFPRLVLVIDWLVTLFAIGGLRLTPRLISEAQKGNSSSRTNQNVRKALVVGAGDAGALVVRELQKNPQLNLIPVGFLDDNMGKQNQQIHGIPVVGALADLPRVMNHQKIDEVIIAIPSAHGKVVRLVADVCRLKAVPFRTMPGIYELLGGKVSINRLREVDIADLLQREAIKTNDELVGATLSSKVVMVTGAGGSIGRELCRQISRWAPVDLILLGHGENSIFESYLELQESHPSQSIRPVIVDVRDKKRMEQIFQRYNPEVVFHAAAHKHVPLMEVNVEDAISNNVSGTRNLVDCCLAYDVSRLVMISTDKAIRPANVMGATKRIAEMIVLEAARTSQKAYSVVRFGNVLGSRGSVVPLFKRQIARGGPVTVTHPDMKRYFMTIPEAVYLVLQSSSMGKGGETFVLNMGQQVRILDLAEDMIKLSGLEPYKDIDIEFTGIRPGEKLSEDLWEEGYIYEPTAHPEIFRLESQENLQNGPLDDFIANLVQLSADGKSDEVVRVLDETIPGSSIHCYPPPEISSII